MEEEYPGCPVGCVGIATGIAMLYCRDSVTISGEYFDLYAIREGMKNGVSLGPIYGEIHHPKYLDSNLMCNFTTITHVIKTTSIYNPCMTIMY